MKIVLFRITNVVVIFFLCLVTSSYSQNSSDSIDLELSRRITFLETQIRDFEIEKQYFQTALNMQTLIFSLIVFIFVSLFALLTFAGLRYDIKNYKNQIAFKLREYNRLVEENISMVNGVIDEVQKRNKEAILNINKTYAEISDTIAEINKHYKISYVKFKLLSCKFFLKIQEIEKAKEISEDAFNGANKVTKEEAQSNQQETQQIIALSKELLVFGVEDITTLSVSIKNQFETLSL